MDIKIDYLNDLSIFALRDFARKVGVKSPTSKTKAQLIKEICEIKSGEREPDLSSSRHGRPPKNNISFLDDLNLNPQPFSKNIVFCQPKVNFEYFSDSDIINGYVQIVDSKSAVLWNFKNNVFKCYYIPSEVCFITPIKTGDFVICELQMQDRQLVVKKVLNINGIPILKFEKSRSDFNKITAILPEKRLEIDDLNLDVKYGENIYLYGANSNVNSIAAINLLNKTGRTDKIYINISMLDKNLIYLQELRNADLFVAKLTDKTDYIKQILNLAIERIKRLVEKKDHVVVVVDDLTTLIENPEFEQCAKDLVSLSRATKRSGSATIFSIVDENSKYKKFADKCYKILNENTFEQVLN